MLPGENTVYINTEGVYYHLILASSTRMVAYSNYEIAIIFLYAFDCSCVLQT